MRLYADASTARGQGYSFGAANFQRSFHPPSRYRATALHQSSTPGPVRKGSVVSRTPHAGYTVGLHGPLSWCWEGAETALGGVGRWEEDMSNMESQHSNFPGGRSSHGKSG